MKTCQFRLDYHFQAMLLEKLKQSISYNEITLPQASVKSQVAVWLNYINIFLIYPETTTTLVALVCLVKVNKSTILALN